MRYSVVTFYDWKEMDHGMMTRAGINAEFVQRYALSAMTNYLNLVADKGWEPITTTFVPGESSDDPRRAANKLVVILRNPDPKQ
jgi:hypothetical protein